MTRTAGRVSFMLSICAARHCNRIHLRMHKWISFKSKRFIYGAGILQTTMAPLFRFPRIILCYLTNKPENRRKRTVCVHSQHLSALAVLLINSGTQIPEAHNGLIV